MRAALGRGLGVTFCAVGLAAVAHAQSWNEGRRYQQDERRGQNQGEFQQHNTQKISRAVNALERNDFTMRDAIEEAENRTRGTAIAVECKLSHLPDDRMHGQWSREQTFEDEDRFGRRHEDTPQISPYDRDRYTDTRDFDHGRGMGGAQQAVIEVSVVPDDDNMLKVVTVGAREGRVVRIQDARQVREAAFQDQDDWGTSRQTTFGNIRKAENIIGMDVKNHRDEDLGEIKDLAIDAQTGKIRYAVLSFGGFLGLGDKLFAVPWTALNVQGEDKIILAVEKNRLENAPGFAEAEWPDFSNQQWGTEIHRFYGKTPYWMDDSDFGQRTAMGAGFQNSNRIADLVNQKRLTLTRAIDLAKRESDGSVFKAKFRLANPNELKQLGLVTDDEIDRTTGQMLVADVHTLSDQQDQIEVFCVNLENGEVVKKQGAGGWRSRS